jgi:hypothetical protein
MRYSRGRCSCRVQPRRETPTPLTHPSLFCFVQQPSRAIRFFPYLSKPFHPTRKYNLPRKANVRLTIHSVPNRFSRLVDQNTGIVVEAHDGAVRPLQLFRSAHHNGVSHVASFHLAGGADGGLVGAKVALTLDDDDDAVAWMRRFSVSLFSSFIFLVFVGGGVDSVVGG